MEGGLAVEVLGSDLGAVPDQQLHRARHFTVIDRRAKSECREGVEGRGGEGGGRREEGGGRGKREEGGGGRERGRENSFHIGYVESMLYGSMDCDCSEGKMEVVLKGRRGEEYNRFIRGYCQCVRPSEGRSHPGCRFREG